jgi:hypothetical protein
MGCPTGFPSARRRSSSLAKRLRLLLRYHLGPAARRSPQPVPPFIVGVEVTTNGSDQGQLAPMNEQIEQRHGHGPKERAASAECVNALARNRGLRQLTVRGRLKVLAVALWYAVAHNVMRAVSLRAGRLTRA